MAAHHFGTCPVRARTSKYSVPALESLNTSVGGSRPRSPATRVRFAGIGTVGPQGIAPVAAIGPGSKFRTDRCRRLLRPASTREHVPCFCGPPALQKSAATRFRQCCFPPQFSPFGNPLSVIPPFNRNTPKGANRRGQQHGVFTGAAEETAGPLSPRGAAPRRPSGCRNRAAAWPPLRRGPEGPGALVRPWSVRSSHLPGLSWCSQAHPISAATPCPPCAGRPRP
jgi:hypothetical protein